jgi:hypothetical protein
MSMSAIAAELNLSVARLNRPSARASSRPMLILDERADDAGGSTDKI